MNNIIYMELRMGPKMANGTCGKTIVVGTIDEVPLYYGSVQFIYNTSLGHLQF